MLELPPQSKEGAQVPRPPLRLKTAGPMGPWAPPPPPMPNAIKLAGQQVPLPPPPHAPAWAPPQPPPRAPLGPLMVDQYEARPGLSGAPLAASWRAT